MPKVNVNGMDFYYDIQGTGEPVIFINGVFSSTASWSKQVEVIKNQYQTIVYDLRDQGETLFAKERYDFTQHIKDLKELMDQLKISRANFVGISYGATIATQFAYHYPEKVNKMVLISGFVALDPRTESIFELLRICFEKFTLQEYYKLIMLLGTGPKFYNQLSSMIPQLSEEFNQRFHGNKENPYRLIYAAYHGQVPDLEKIKTIKAPVLIIAGELDNFVSPECSNIMTQYIKNSRLIIFKDCGHSVMLEKPDELNAVILDFLKG